MAKGGGVGRGGGGGGKPTFTGEFAASLRHYFPLWEAGITAAQGGQKNFGQWKFPGTRDPANSAPAPVPMALLGKSALGHQNVAGGNEKIMLSNPTTSGENLGQAFTVGAWVRPVNFSAAAKTIISKGGSGVSTPCNFALQLTQTNGFPQLAFTIANVYKICTGVTAVSLVYPATLVVGTYDGANMRLYLNGRLDKILAQTGTPDTSTVDIHIGEVRFGGGDQQHFHGEITGAFVFNRVLNEGTILRMAAEGPSVFEPPVLPGEAGGGGAGPGPLGGGGRFLRPHGRGGMSDDAEGSGAGQDSPLLVF